MEDLKFFVPIHYVEFLLIVERESKVRLHLMIALIRFFSLSHPANQDHLFLTDFASSWSGMGLEYDQLQFPGHLCCVSSGV